MIDLVQYLKSLPDEEFYYCPNSGRAGDSLIAHTTYQLFNKCKIKFKAVPVHRSFYRGVHLDELRGQNVIFGGGGSLVHYYGDTANFISRHYPEMKRLIILPHTINAYQKMLRQFGSNVDIICREKTSYQFVKDIARNANVLLMDDVVFNLDISQTFREKPDLSKGSYLLRFLGELNQQNVSNGVEVVEDKDRDLFRKQNNKPATKTLNCFREDLEKTDLTIPKPNFDLAHAFTLDDDFDELLVHELSYRFLKCLSYFEGINTNRLHVCIAGALLGKSVNFYPNSYYKNFKVYEFSIKDKFSNVKWMG